ncbi:hypothetical protein GF391_04350 [Candidatus Uhrbacteria bacterium]|nr:hypothetical protein [Candidatus Uhrbacteria bacterium]
MKYLTILLIFISFLGAGCFGFGSEKIPNLNKNCAQADYPFACYLDKAMLAEDPNLCLAAGAKRMNCLRSYQEIMGVEISCDDLDNPEFRSHCEVGEILQEGQGQNTSTQEVIERSAE